MLVLLVALIDRLSHSWLLVALWLSVVVVLISSLLSLKRASSDVDLLWLGLSVHKGLVVEIIVDSGHIFFLFYLLTAQNDKYDSSDKHGDAEVPEADDGEGISVAEVFVHAEAVLVAADGVIVGVRVGVEIVAERKAAVLAGEVIV